MSFSPASPYSSAAGSRNTQYGPHSTPLPSQLPLFLASSQLCLTSPVTGNSTSVNSISPPASRSYFRADAKQGSSPQEHLERPHSEYAKSLQDQLALEEAKFNAVMPSPRSLHRPQNLPPHVRTMLSLSHLACTLVHPRPSQRFFCGFLCSQIVV